MRVVIAEDSVLLRAGINAAARRRGHRGGRRPSEDGDGLLVSVSEHRPDLAIVDVRMPPSFTDEGLRAALKAREQQPGLPVLVLSQYVEERYAVELLSGGAGGVGYLLKERVADVAEFVDAVQRVAGGGTCIDQEVIAQFMARGRRNPIDVLTPREREVLGPDGAGHDERGHRQVADRLGRRGREARGQHLLEARPGAQHARSTGGSGRS